MKRKIAGFLTRLWVPPFKAERPPSKKVAIVVPLSNRTELLPDELVSLKQLRQHLGRYDKFAVAPPGVDLRLDDFKSIRFPAKYFGSVAAHNRMLISPDFYRAFLDYEYIFFYHLDSLAFSDELEQWCSAGWDFIGPPFIPCDETPWIKEPRVGNGGFALLRVESALKVIYNRYREEPGSFWLDMFTRNGAYFLPWIRLMEWVHAKLPGLPVIRGLVYEWRASENPIGLKNNDMFWSFLAGRFFPDFRLAPVEEGLRFAFEAAPRKCLEMNGGRMPFGCHAWGRYDRAFWEQYLLNGNREVPHPQREGR
jgi:hypothetical protein